MKWWKLVFWIAIALVVLLTVYLLAAGPTPARASPGTNISATMTERFAWDDAVGWWDFYAPNTVTVFSTRLEGYASSSAGELSLDCSTSPAGNICGTSNYGICNGPGPHSTNGACPSGDGSGTLTGFAWNDTIGWVSMNCNNAGHEGGSNLCPPSGPANYGVSVDANGEFSGCAWNDVVGWISFNNTGVCSAAVAFKVVTTWRATSTFGYLESAVLDTELTGGGILQSIIWQGSQPAGTSVDFQIATSSDAGGPWTYYGPGGATITYYGVECPISGIASPGAGPNKAICVDKNAGSARYLRYKVRLRSNLLQTETPRVDDIILNWTK